MELDDKRFRLYVQHTIWQAQVHQASFQYLFSFWGVPKSNPTDIWRYRSWILHRRLAGVGKYQMRTRWKAQEGFRQVSQKEPATELQQMQIGSDRGKIFGALLDKRRSKTWQFKNFCNNWNGHTDLQGWTATISWNSYLSWGIYPAHVNSNNFKIPVKMSRLPGCQWMR